MHFAICPCQPCQDINQLLNIWFYDRQSMWASGKTRFYLALHTMCRYYWIFNTRLLNLYVPLYVQGWVNIPVPGCENFSGKFRQKWKATAGTKFTKPGNGNLAHPCTRMLGCFAGRLLAQQHFNPTKIGNQHLSCLLFLLWIIQSSRNSRSKARVLPGYIQISAKDHTLINFTKLRSVARGTPGAP